MSVDCTHLLNLRHVEDKDNAWMTAYPGEGDDDEPYSFDQVIAYGAPADNDAAVVSYGDGVVVALQVRFAMSDASLVASVVVSQTELYGFVRFVVAGQA